jgi:protein TonB
MLPNRAFGTAFIISLLGHGLFLSALPFDIEPARPERSEELIFQMEIEEPALLPPIKKMGEEKKLANVEAKPKPEPLPEPGKTTLPEDPIPQNTKTHRQAITVQPSRAKVEVLNSSEEAMLRYQDMVRQRLEEVREYPDWAKEQGIEGNSRLRFTILSDGSIHEVKLVDSSGSKILDREALATIKRASPFPAFPKAITVSSIKMEVGLVFTLQ